MSLDEAKLDTALSTHYAAVKALFINQSTSVGIAQRLSQAIDGMDAIDSGSIAIRKNTITSDISRLTNEIGKKTDALSVYEEQVRRQYAALDGLLRQLQSQSNALLAKR